MTENELSNRIDELQKTLKEKLNNLEIVQSEHSAIQRNILIARANVADLTCQLHDKKTVIDKAKHVVRDIELDIEITTREFWNSRKEFKS